MKIRDYISFFGLSAIIIITTISATGCANIVPPAGGDKDTLAPLLIRAVPRDSTRNFEGNRINFSFDEYVAIDNFSQNVIVSPIPKRIPTYTSKLNTLSLRLKDTLEPNTTYTIDFGEAIKDVNEGNIMKDFTYVFSTGPYIDSLSFSGNVILAETGKTDSTLIVILHNKAEDSVVINERPRYMTKLNGKGVFTFHNLPPGTFYAYAMKDDSRSMRYNAKQLFAFADSPVIVNQNTSAKTLYAYLPKAAETSSSVSSAQGKGEKRLKFQTTASNNIQDLLKKFSFQFETPLRQFDSTKVRFATDTLFTTITRGYSWTLDSTRKKLTLNYEWQEGTFYHLILDKEFATDTLGQKLLRSDTVSFKTMSNTDYGKLSIRLRNLDMSKNPVLQFVQSGVVVNSFPLTEPFFQKNLFLPGEYELRILLDANKNGVWDTGEFFGKHRQPEIVKPIERQITVKENWENEVEIAL